MNGKASRADEIASLLCRLGELLATVESPPNTKTPEKPRDLPERVLLTVEEAAERLGIGRTTAFALVKSGEIASVQIGRLRRVPADAIREYSIRLVTNQRDRQKAA